MFGITEQLPALLLFLLQVITQQQFLMLLIAKQLLEKEVIHGEDVEKILGPKIKAQGLILRHIIFERIVFSKWFTIRGLSMKKKFALSTF